MRLSSLPFKSCSGPSFEMVCVLPMKRSKKDDICEDRQFFQRLNYQILHSMLKNRSCLQIRCFLQIFLDLPQVLFNCIRRSLQQSGIYGLQVFKYRIIMEEFLKLLIIGDSGVGKSCILSRFCENKFTEAFYNTIGVDFKTKSILVDGKKCKLQIWDTAGQERFRTITSNYYKGAHGILIVFDLTSKQSLKNTSFWLQEIEKFGSPQSSVILIGNKNDLASKREVSEDEALIFAKKNNLDYIECSAFNSLNINLVFEAIVRKVIRERAKKEKQEMETPLGNRVNNSKTNLTNIQDKNGQRQKNNCC